MEYKLSRSQRWKYIFFPLIKLSAVIVIATMFGVVWFETKTENLLMVIGLSWVWIFLVHLLPLLIMGIRHNHLSKDSYFSVDTVGKMYRYTEKHISISFQLTEIQKVIKVVSPPKYDKRIDILGFGYFFYWKIILSDGTILSISCMLLDVDNFPGKEVSQEKRIFPVPPSNHWISAQTGE